MARDKATITLDRAKVADAMALTGRSSMSEVIDAALDELIRNERLRHDVRAYTSDAGAARDLVLGELPVVLDLADDDVDYESLYGPDA